jgi:metallophosphoesterase (TIGR00282 family)
MEENVEIIRPINFGESAAGRGHTILDANGYRILVINAMGNVHVEPNLDSPFSYVDRVLRYEEGKYDFSILDIHAEATGEKLAVGYAYDGRINIVFGTHTHVPTADEQILPRGTGYITDLGMSGPTDGILGTAAEPVIKKFLTKMPQRFTVAEGDIAVNGALFTIDTDTRRVVKVERVRF